MSEWLYETPQEREINDLREELTQANARVAKLEGILRRVHAQFTSHGDDRMIMPKDSLMFEDIEKALGGEE